MGFRLIQIRIKNFIQQFKINSIKINYTNYKLTLMHTTRELCVFGASINVSVIVNGCDL